MLIDGLELFADDALAGKKADEQVEQALKTVRRYAAAVDWNQRLTTFVGIDPDTPSLRSPSGLPAKKDELVFLKTQ